MSQKQKPKILFITGPPTTNYTLQAERLVRDYHYCHISLSKLIKNVLSNPESDKAESFQKQISKGELISDGEIINLLSSEIKKTNSNKLLITGFPRTNSQAHLFEAKIQAMELILYFKETNRDEICTALAQKGQDRGLNEDQIETVRSFYRNDFHSFIETYQHLNLVKSIDQGLNDKEQYIQIKKCIQPNIIYFYGPPCVGKTEVAKEISQKIKYEYINMQQLIQQQRDNVDSANYFIDWVNSKAEQNILFDSFDFDQAQSELIFKCLGLPQKIFYFEIPKDEVFDRIYKYLAGTQKDQAIKEYQKFIEKRNDILKSMQNQSYFVNVNANETISKINKQIIADLKPLFLVLFLHHNQDLGYEYAQQLEDQRGFIYIDCEELIEIEIQRGTTLGGKLKSFQLTGQNPPAKFMVDLIAKIIFRSPTQKKYLCVGFPTSSDQFLSFENLLFDIDYLISFTRPNQELTYCNYESPLMKYFSMNKHIFISQPNLDILDAYINRRPKYGIVVGSSCVGKTTICDYIKKAYDYQIMKWDNEDLETNVKNLQKDPDSVETVTFEMYIEYFKSIIYNSSQKLLVFDGMGPHAYEAFKEMFPVIGLPNFVINLSIDESKLMVRYKIKNGMDLDAEIEDRAPFDQIRDQGKAVHQSYKELASQNYGMNLFDVDCNLSLYSTQKCIDAIFQHRVCCVADLIPDYSEQDQQNLNEIKLEQKLLFVNTCINKDIIFIDVPKLVKEAYWRPENELYDQFRTQFKMRGISQGAHSPSTYTPELLLKLIQNYLEKFFIKKRDILLYGYPSSDIGDDTFSRASEEMIQIQNTLGPIRILNVICEAKKQFVIQDDVWELPKPEPKKKEMIINEETGVEEEKKDEEEDVDEDNEENQKKKFDKFEYSWTKSEAKKSILQWYNNNKISRKFNYSLQDSSYESVYKNIIDKFDLINEKNEQNNEDDQIRKTNISVQLVYNGNIYILAVSVEEDIVVEEEEEEVANEDLLVEANREEEQQEEEAQNYDEQEQPEEQPEAADE